jgi:hypothetical protein
MGESRRRRKVYQHLHGGPLPPGEKPPVAVQLTILVTPALRDAIVEEFEVMAKPKDRQLTLQDFHERLLFGGFSAYMEWKAKQQEEGSIVKLAGAPDLARLAAKGVVR